MQKEKSIQIIGVEFLKIKLNLGGGGQERGKRTTENF